MLHHFFKKEKNPSHGGNIRLKLYVGNKLGGIMETAAENRGSGCGEIWRQSGRLKLRTVPHVSAPQPLTVCQYILWRSVKKAQSERCRPSSRPSSPRPVIIQTEGDVMDMVIRTLSMKRQSSRDTHVQTHDSCTGLFSTVWLNSWWGLLVLLNAPNT